MFIIGLIALNTHARINEHSIYLTAILLIQFSPIFILVGPALYFYIHFYLYKKYRFTYYDLIHLAPALFLFVNELPYLFMPFSEKIMVAKLVHLKLSYLFSVQLAFINVKMTLIFRSSIIILYLLYGYVLFFRFRKSSTFLMLTNQERKRHINWMFLFLFSSTVLFGGIMFAIDSPKVLTQHFYFSISGIGIFFLIISLISYPTILYGAKFDFEPNKVIIKSIKLPKIKLLDQSQLIHIDALVATFLVDLPYIRNDFNLNNVSLEIGIPKYQLTYYLNTYLHLSFNSWRDKLRIIYAKGLISKGEAKSLTLESVGKQAGFQSRDKFTRAFKAQTGINPSDFLKTFKI